MSMRERVITRVEVHLSDENSGRWMNQIILRVRVKA